MENNHLFYRENDANQESLFVQKALKMADSKVVMFLLKFILPPLYIFAWLSNLDNIKSTILFIFALLFMMIRMYFWIIRARQNNRMRELDILERERQLFNKN